MKRVEGLFVEVAYDTDGIDDMVCAYTFLDENIQTFF